MIWLSWILWVGQPVVFEGGFLSQPDGAKPVVLIVDDFKLAYVGESIPKEWANKIQQHLSLDGGYVLPGLIDAHAHLSSLGNALESVDLVGTSSYQEVVARAKNRAAQLPKGTWITGRGWDQNDWETTEFPHHDALSQAVPDHPVVLKRIDGHASLANALAMKLSGVTSDTKSPDGGVILSNESGPTGVFVDDAMGLILEPPMSVSDLERQISKASDHVAALGLTAIHDAGIDENEWIALKNLAEAGKLPIRVYAMIAATDHKWLQRQLKQGPLIDLYDGFLTLRSIKVYSDGALGSRGAWLKQPYSDAPDTVGLQLTPDNEMDVIVEQAARAGFQVNTHAIGDRGNQWVLQHVAQAQKIGVLDASARFRMEHAQVVDPADFDAFVKLGVLPSMQPTHCTSDMPWAPKRLGARTTGAYAWRTFIEKGLPIPMGSDFPVEQPNPFLGLYAAVTTQDLDGQPAEGFRPTQKLSRTEALLGFTEWAAYSAFQEDRKGKLEKGFWADFTVTDRDYFAVPSHEIPRLNVLMTVVGGRVIFRR